MKLYIETKKMTFEDNIEHEIILKIANEEFYGYDKLIKLSDNDKFIKNTLEIVYKDTDKKEIDYYQFNIREKSWDSFPLYEIVDNEIVAFDYKKYQYFSDTDRRVVLATKINDLYNPSSETKILRKTLKYIMDTLDIKYPDFFKKYDDKIGEIINRNPK